MHYKSSKLAVCALCIPSCGNTTHVCRRDSQVSQQASYLISLQTSKLVENSHCLIASLVSSLEASYF